MLGAVIGDVAGSRFEFQNHKTADIYDFELFGKGSRFTDDTVLTLAVARAILDASGDRSRLPEAARESLWSMGRAWPGRGYGARFKKWLEGGGLSPCGSLGNGAGMRASPCGLAAATVEEAKALSRAVTAPTHDHPEGLKGAEAVAVGVRLAASELSMEEIRERLGEYYRLDFTIEAIRPGYRFDVSCPGSVPQALEAFLESEDFEGAVRLAISLGGDSDTIAAMAGGLAEARWGIPESLRREAMGFLPEDLAGIVERFEAAYPPKTA